MLRIQLVSECTWAFFPVWCQSVSSDAFQGLAQHGVIILVIAIHTVIRTSCVCSETSVLLQYLLYMASHDTVGSVSTLLWHFEVITWHNALAMHNIRRRLFTSFFAILGQDRFCIFCIFSHIGTAKWQSHVWSWRAYVPNIRDAKICKLLSRF